MNVKIAFDIFNFHVMLVDMIRRNAEDRASWLAGHFPALTVTGPRQSGKTTLCRRVFPEHKYVSLEDPDIREIAIGDPRAFLRELGDIAILDEIQRVPVLLSYLQGIIDRDPSPGRYILTGSANLALLDDVSQSLAGRTALLHLLPCSFDELSRFSTPPGEVWDTVWGGGFPAIFDRGMPAYEWYRAYIETFVERDLRSLATIGDLNSFRTFVKLCAAVSGQRLNLTRLGTDASVTHTTARRWLSTLEAGFLVRLLPPYLPNLRKRLVKQPKLMFADTGLACSLLGIRDASQLRLHPLRGPLFESWVAMEVCKERLHRGLSEDIYHVAVHSGHEVDLVVPGQDGLTLVEVKSGETFVPRWIEGLLGLQKQIRERTGECVSRLVLVYAGNRRFSHRGVIVVPWSQIASIDWS